MQVFQLLTSIEEKLGYALPLSRLNSALAALGKYESNISEDLPLSSEQSFFAEQLRPLADKILHTQSSEKPQAFLTFAQSLHALCAIPLREVTADMGINAWLCSDYKGLSSMYLASVVAKGPDAPFAEPCDFDDIRRCVKLLYAVPEAQLALDVIAGHSPRWAFFVHNFPTLLDFISLEIQGSPIPDDLSSRIDTLNEQFMSLSQ